MKMIKEIHIEKVNSDKSVDECWEWIGAIDTGGYERFNVGGSSVFAHRVSFLLSSGFISSEMVIDHICRNKKCVNSRHLRQASFRTNILENSIGPATKNLSKKLCDNGHEFNEENTLVVKNGRKCKECKRANERRKYISSKKGETNEWS